MSSLDGWLPRLRHWPTDRSLKATHRSGKELFPCPTLDRVRGDRAVQWPFGTDVSQMDCQGLGQKVAFRALSPRRHCDHPATSARTTLSVSGLLSADRNHRYPC